MSNQETVELYTDTGTLSNGRWWRERDKRLNNIEGDLLRIEIDLDELEQALRKAEEVWDHLRKDLRELG